jgi:ATP-dependent 26S proteasome regulatory subunit
MHGHAIIHSVTLIHSNNSTGTGKTTIARRVGRLFQQLGLLASGEVVEVSAGDFVTGYVGQSAGKTREVFQSALGGVLFIDEAYRCHTVCAAAVRGCCTVVLL